MLGGVLVCGCGGCGNDGIELGGVGTCGVVVVGGGDWQATVRKAMPQESKKSLGVLKKRIIFVLLSFGIGTGVFRLGLACINVKSFLVHIVLERALRKGFRCGQSRFKVSISGFRNVEISRGSLSINNLDFQHLT